MTTYYESKIYKITSAQTPDIYIGSTTKTLNSRLTGHKMNYRKYLRGKYAYVTSFEIVKYPDCKIELLELCNFDTKEQLRRREGEYILNNECINMRVAGRTRKETCKNYYNNNKDKIKKYKAEKFNCLCSGKYTNGTKSRHLKSKKHHIYKNKKIKDITKTIIMIYKLSNIILYNNNHGCRFTNKNNE
jgi:hypothetical protein